MLFVLMDVPGRPGGCWKLHECRLSRQDEALYWRDWAATVDDAENAWLQEQDARCEKARIKAALLQYKIPVSCASMSSLQAAPAAPAEIRLQAAGASARAYGNGDDYYSSYYYNHGHDKSSSDADDDEEAYWNSYDAVVTPSADLLSSLRVIRKFESMPDHDDNSESVYDWKTHSMSPSPPYQHQRHQRNLHHHHLHRHLHQQPSGLSFLPLLPADESVY
ncbi:hypothetical protein V1514DRAFT_325316 [Lipomyces japonicus]|uniref:uncharacterized protein n=1 Tax=Lipomyces japonicus TaxID=56871 RepID=UPI0034CF2C06